MEKHKRFIIFISLRKFKIFHFCMFQIIPLGQNELLTLKSFHTNAADLSFPQKEEVFLRLNNETTKWGAKMCFSFLRSIFCQKLINKIKSFSLDNKRRVTESLSYDLKNQIYVISICSKIFYLSLIKFCANTWKIHTPSKSEMTRWTHYFTPLQIF